MFNTTLLQLMKPAGVLVNIARGPVVDEDALYHALETRQIGGAVLDVWWNDWAWMKPEAVWPASHNFSQLSNVVITPHIASMTTKARLDAIRQAARNLDHLSRGEPLE